jgi:ketosteroid isomerase-like protein
MRSALLVSLMFFASAAAAQTDSTPAWQREIASVLLRQSDAWNSGDIAGYMDGYWNSDSLLFTSGGSVRRGWQETFDKYKKKYATKDLMGTLTFSRIEYHLLSEGSAWVFGSWALARATDRPNGVFTLVLRKIGGSWKIVHDHTSSSTQ